MTLPARPPERAGRDGILDPHRCTGRQSGETWQYLPGRARPVAPVLAVRPPGGASKGSQLPGRTFPPAI